MVFADIYSALSTNAYPGRGIVMGVSPDGKKSVCAYFIMGRSSNSRNRVFEKTEDGIRTKAHDPSKLEDPSLIIYHPVREVAEGAIVTNGDQTDTIRDCLAEGKSFMDAMRKREFEPDEPNFTPRISGLMAKDGSYCMSILKSDMGDGSRCCRYLFEYDCPRPGTGTFIHTYVGDGNPLPSFEGEPERVMITEDNAEALAAKLWESLNKDNKISLYVRYQDLASGEIEEKIINVHESK